MTDMQMVQGPGGWAVLALLGLGALHGINPAMGWLFAVALGLQEKRARAVWRALPPLALGHALAIAAVVAVVATIGVLVPVRVLRLAVALLLGGFGVYRLFRHTHFRYGGMRVGARELTIWSFLMATAHGAGLMVLPFVLDEESGRLPRAHASWASGLRGTPEAGHGAGGHAAHAGHAVDATSLAGIGGEQAAALLVTLIHTAGYLLVMGVLAIVVYRKLGLRLLRRAWINLDLIWSGALIVTAVATVLM